MLGSWSSAETDPPGIDLAFWRLTNTLPNLCLATILAAMLAFVAGGAGARWFHLANHAAPVLFGAWPLSVGLMWWLDERLHRPSYRPLLGVILIHGVALFAVLGACSTDDFGAGWATLLLLPPCWGHLFPSNRTILVATLVVPTAERVLFVPGASSSSLALAAASGGGVAIAYWTFSARRLRVRAHEQQRLAREAFGAATAEEAASLLTSMRLHDGLSGLLMLAHARAARGSDCEALDAARSFAQHARIVLVAFTPRGRATTSDLRADFELFARRVGLTLDIDLELEANPTSPAVDELREIVFELVANHARHNDSPVARLRIDVSRRRVRARLHGGAAAARGDGRGLRNLALRVAAHGGRAWQEQSGDEMVIGVAIPLDERGSRWSALLPIEGLIHLGAPALAWACGSGAWVAGTLVVASSILAAVQVRTSLRLGAARAEARRTVRASIDDATGPAMALVKGALVPGLERIERAVNETHAGDARAALEDLSTRMQSLLSTLEQPSVWLSARDRASTQPARLAADS